MIVNSIQQKTWRSLQEKEEGFTLVELIIVVVIIGILSAIAIPSFQNSSDKAKQKEVAILISSYIKAAQAYKAEYGGSLFYTNQLGNYVSISGCQNNNPAFCRANQPIDYTHAHQIDMWYSPSGLFKLRIDGGSSTINIRAIPDGSYSNTGYGVAGCYNPMTGITKVINMTSKGTRVPIANC